MEWNKEAQETLERLCRVWPEMIRGRWKERLVKTAEWKAAFEGKKTIDRDWIWNCAKEVVPKSYEPIFLKEDDPQEYRQRVIMPFMNEEAYTKVPIEIKRWQTPSNRKDVALKKKPDEVKVVAFCGSPRKKGNTSTIIDEALRGAQSTGALTEKVMVDSLKIHNCIGCRRCHDQLLSTYCSIKDDMTPLFDKILAADCIVVGFPIYTARECGQIAVFFDRLDGLIGPGFKSRIQERKRGMIITTWGYPNIDAYEHIVEDHLMLLSIYNIEPVEALSASGFEGMLHGLDKEKSGMVLKHPECLTVAFEAGKGLVS
jgi:multimeric flavodoxin WrbA